MAVSGVMLGSPQLWLPQDSFVFYPNSWCAHACGAGAVCCWELWNNGKYRAKPVAFFFFA